MSIRKPREQDLVRPCLDLLALCGCFAWRQNQGAMAGTSGTGKKWFMRFTSEPGVSDIIGLAQSGRMIAVELKLPGEEPKPHQQSFLDRVASHNGLALVVTSVADLQRQLRAAGFGV